MIIVCGLHDYSAWSKYTFMIGNLHELHGIRQCFALSIMIVFT